MSTLTFEQLRAANIARLPLFKDANGAVCHKEDGSDWDLCAWLTAMCGEVGEAANIIKKIKRGDHDLYAVRKELGHELADVQIYLDILAFQCGMNLGELVVEKFNLVSEKQGLPVKLEYWTDSSAIKMIQSKFKENIARLENAHDMDQRFLVQAEKDAKTWKTNYEKTEEKVKSLQSELEKSQSCAQDRLQEITALNGDLRGQLQRAKVAEESNEMLRTRIDNLKSMVGRL